MNEIERRLDALESANRKYKAGLTASLSALGVVALAGFGQVPPQQQQHYPRTIVADSITVQSISAYSGTINILGSNNLTSQVATIGSADVDTISAKVGKVNDLQVAAAAIKQLASGRIQVKSGSGTDAVVISGSNGGGSVSVADANGQAVGYFAGTPDGGLLQIGSKGGFTGLEAYADEKCGRLRTLNGSGKVLTSLGRTDKGDGEVVAHTRNGNRVVIMRSNDSGDWGSFLIQKEGGEPIVSADGDDKGGYVKTLDGKNDTARLPSK